MIRLARTGAIFAVLVGMAGCGPDYSPNTYSSNAVQQANKVEPGIIVGVRQIGVSAAGVVGAATGAAAGGVAGAQAPGGGLGSAFGAIGGGLVGGLIGNSVEHVAGDTQAYEYIVREPNKDLVSVTQKDKTPLKIGTKVLVIAGNQARIVPDYTVPIENQPPGTPLATKPPEAGPDAAAATPAAEAPAAGAPAGAAAAPANGAQPATAATAPSGTEPPATPVAASPLPAPTSLAPAAGATTAAPPAAAPAPAAAAPAQ